MTGYAEFAVTTSFSFLRGASHGEELVMQGKTLGLAGLGVADRNSVAGVVRAHQAAKRVCPSRPARGSCSATARRTFSPIPKAAPHGAG
jgi:DNA polymerase III alpha subunit